MKVPRPGGQTKVIAKSKVDIARCRLKEAGGKIHRVDEQKSHQAWRLGESAIEDGALSCHVKASGKCGGAGGKEMSLTHGGLPDGNTLPVVNRTGRSQLTP